MDRSRPDFKRRWRGAFCVAPFGGRRIGSTLIERDKPLTVNYRLWLQEGLMRPDQVAALSDNFVDPVTITLHDQ
jgi:hypothetical protein